MIMASFSSEVEASCAICGAPANPECPHEGERLKLALDQAMERWSWLEKIRDWVLTHARNQIILTFHALRDARYQRTIAYLQTLPCYPLYVTFHGNPPLQPLELAHLHAQIAQAEKMYKVGVDEDWRRSCLRYPEVLDYYFSLVEVSVPGNKDLSIREPRFGGPAVVPVAVMGAEGRRKVRVRRESVDLGRPERRKEKRRATPPPPAAPMVGAYIRR